MGPKDFSFNIEQGNSDAFNFRGKSDILGVQNIFLCLISCNLQTTVSTHSVSIFSEFSYSNIKFGEMQSKSGEILRAMVIEC